MIVEARAAGRVVREDLLAHARVPEAFHVVGDRGGDAVRAGFRFEERADVVRHLDQVFGLHARLARSARDVRARTRRAGVHARSRRA